jgi:signal transduction histidine kinase
VPHDRIRKLERKLAASEKVVRVLSAGAEAKIAQSGSPVGLLTQNVGLERVVRQKTQELADALEALRRTQMELAHANKLTAIGELAAGVAHEINTPVQYVMDNTHFLQKVFGTLCGLLAEHQAAVSDVEHALPPERRDALQKASKKARVEYLQREVPRAIGQSLEGLARVTTIVSAMKTFSHSSGGEMAQVNLREAIESTVTLARNEWKYVAEVELDLDPRLELVTCMRDEMNQVILNLVVNAAHAIGEVPREEGDTTLGRIVIATRADGDTAEIRVSDTGVGIPDALRERVFEPFFTTKAVGKGTGQGLAIVYSVIVEKHDGTIAIESEVGRGTTMIVRFPRQQHDVPSDDAVEGVSP